MRRETVNVDQLKLSEENPRVGETDSQTSSMQLIYNSCNEESQSKSRRQLLRLAESIALNGYQNEVEPILTTESGDNSFVVADANRRLTAIRLLTDPDQYKDILDPADLSKLKKLAADPEAHVPTQLEIIVFSSSESEKLHEILARKHGGPLDGAGTVPWSTIAKSRFFGHREFADKLEAPFEEQFGESLSSYLGGSQAVTSTRRIFNSRPVQNYLAIQDPDHPTQEELDKVKSLADETRSYCQLHDIPLSRLNIHEIQEGLIQPLISRGTEAPLSPAVSAKRTFQQRMHDLGICMERQLGSRYNRPEWIPDDPNFMDLDFLLAGLMTNGELTGDESARKQKTYLLSPAIRSIYELALLGINESGVGVQLPQGISTHHTENVNFMQEKFKDNHFKQYLSEQNKLFTNFQDANSVINTANFGTRVSEAQLSAHKSARSLDIDQVKSAFNFAVLFALLCEHYVAFLRTNTATGQ